VSGDRLRRGERRRLARPRPDCAHVRFCDLSGLALPARPPPARSGSTARCATRTSRAPTSPARCLSTATSAARTCAAPASPEPACGGARSTTPGSTAATWTTRCSSAARSPHAHLDGVRNASSARDLVVEVLRRQGGRRPRAAALGRPRRPAARLVLRRVRRCARHAPGAARPRAGRVPGAAARRPRRGAGGAPGRPPVPR
jgi:hypothetical protein